ncbi:MAG: acylphosphatase [Eubacterium sp.]
MDKPQILRYRIIFSGRVQGVGFRYFAQKLAVEFSLVGFVKNRLDENVEMEIEGTAKHVNAFIKAIRHGNPFIRVDDYSMKAIPLGYDTRFQIKY